jgi:hypothetical protein
MHAIWFWLRDALLQHSQPCCSPVAHFHYFGPDMWQQLLKTYTFIVGICWPTVITTSLRFHLFLKKGAGENFLSNGRDYKNFSWLRLGIFFSSGLPSSVLETTGALEAGRANAWSLFSHRCCIYVWVTSFTAVRNQYEHHSVFSCHLHRTWGWQAGWTVWRSKHEAVQRLPSSPISISQESCSSPNCLLSASCGYKFPSFNCMKRAGVPPTGENVFQPWEMWPWVGHCLGTCVKTAFFSGVGLQLFP